MLAITTTNFKLLRYHWKNNLFKETTNCKVVYTNTNGYKFSGQTNFWNGKNGANCIEKLESVEFAALFEKPFNSMTMKAGNFEVKLNDVSYYKFNDRYAFIRGRGIYSIWSRFKLLAQYYHIDIDQLLDLPPYFRV